VGFPIRKSADQSFFAAPRGLSQRSTSFIASQRQGIHRMPLRHLIALIINAHRTRRACRSRMSGGTLMRKTSLLSSRSIRRRAVKLADLNRVCAPAMAFATTRLGSIPSSRCQRTRVRLRLCAEGGREFVVRGRAQAIPAGGARRDRTDDLLLAKQALSQLSYGPIKAEMVGLDRLERSTSPLSGVRSNHLSYRPSRAHAGKLQAPRTRDPRRREPQA
jgi:hypothetical protein